MKKTSRIARTVLAALLFSGVANAAIISEFVADGVNAPGISGFNLTDSTPGQTRYYTNETYNGTSYDAWAMNSPPTDKGSYYQSIDDATSIANMKTNGYTLTYIARTDTAVGLGHHRLRWLDAGRQYRVYFKYNGANSSVWLDTPGSGSTEIMGMNLSDGYHIFQVAYIPKTPGVYSDDDELDFYVDGVLIYTSTRVDAAYVGTEVSTIRVEFGDASTSASAGLFHVNTVRLEDGIHVVETPVLAKFVADGFSAPGDWGFSLSGGTGGQTRYYTNETYNGTSYYAWAFDSPADAGSGYYHGTFDKGNIETNGYTLTYIARTVNSQAAGYELVRLYDGASTFRLYLRGGPHAPASEDNLLLSKPGGGYEEITTGTLTNDYNNLQMTVEPETPGSFGDNDTVSFYLNGILLYTTNRVAAAEASTTVVRLDFGTHTGLAASLFHVNTVQIEEGINVVSPSQPPAIGDIAVEYLGAPGMALTWTTANGFNYALLEKGDLALDPTWSTNQSGIPGEEDGSTTVTTAVDSAQAFFKVISEE